MKDPFYGMKHDMKNNESVSGTHRLFVYGTLRKGGLSEHYVAQYPLLEQAVKLQGFALYDAGWYPFAIPDKTSSIIGDIREIREQALVELDEYEGDGYKRHYLAEGKALIYLKVDSNVKGLVQVPGGDWLKYFLKRS